MYDDVVASYYDVQEEYRLNSTKARKVEYFTTINTINDYVKVETSVLDIGCGCGIYSLYYAERGLSVTAVDIVPKHIEILQENAKQKNVKIDAYVGNATSLDKAKDESADIVLCLGPLYHLTDIEEQKKCLRECRRVVKSNGYIILAYLSCYAVFPYVVRGHREFLRKSLMKKIIDRHYVEANDEDCFWTDNYFHAPEEIERLVEDEKLFVIDHLAADGQSIAFQQMINQFSDDEFQQWMEYHYKICREKSVIGSSNHGIIVARKE